ncbi:MAG: sulfotransferase domain-containing protein [Nitrosospira sp.]|nr:sulfotransferase domain-containing protein [Nitrosospira sp.]
MPLPNFLIIGAQKSGTTWLLQRLGQHPDVFIPPQEVHFFDKAYNFRKGCDWYRQFFDGATEEKAIGEKTPDYYWTGTNGAEDHLPNVHRNIHQMLPETRLVLMLRNPVDRAISAVNHIVRSGRVFPGHRIDALLVGDKHHLVEPHGVIDYGRYMKHVSAFMELFDREQLLILIFEEDLVEKPACGLRKLTHFLEVYPTFPFTNLREKNNAPPTSTIGLYTRYHLPAVRPLATAADYLFGTHTFKPQPSNETIDELYRIYEKDNNQLFDFLGRGIETWKKPG